MNELVKRYVHLSDLLAKYEEIKRAIKLPHGENESDSHHAFSLAMISYDICKQYKLDINTEKVLLYALVHDLVEMITGDSPTLTMNARELQEKHEREKRASHELEEILKDYPYILRANEEYERLDSPEAATVFVLDKTCTIWAHFHDDGDNLHSLGVETKADIDRWYNTTKQKIKTRLHADPPQKIYEIFEKSFLEMRENLCK